MFLKYICSIISNCKLIKWDTEQLSELVKVTEQAVTGMKTDQGIDGCEGRRLHWLSFYSVAIHKI